MLNAVAVHSTQGMLQVCKKPQHVYLMGIMVNIINICMVFIFLKLIIDLLYHYRKQLL